MGVIKGGKLAFVKGYGAADLTHGIPFTPETPTNIGSSTKQFTGFALALLVPLAGFTALHFEHSAVAAFAHASVAALLIAAAAYTRFRPA